MKGMDLSRSQIVVTGGTGFLGYWVVQKLRSNKAANIFVPTSTDYDLRNRAACEAIVKNQDIVIHLAAHVGGIGANKAYPGQLFYDNAVMGIELMEAARKAHVKKMLIVGTACSYPKYCTVPFKEEELWQGYPDEITGVYGLAKKMLLVQAQAYRKEYGFNAIYMIPVNLFGPRDNFDKENGHVIPSLIMRMIEAQQKKDKRFVVWGSGLATREFIFVKDAAEGIVKAVQLYNGAEPVNLGSGREISIKDLVLLLKELIGFSGDIVWDATKPDGQPRRLVDTSKAKAHFQFEAKTDLKAGLKETIQWYLKNQKVL